MDIIGHDCKHLRVNVLAIKREGARIEMTFGLIKISIITRMEIDRQNIESVEMFRNLGSLLFWETTTATKKSTIGKDYGASLKWKLHQ